MDGFSFLPWGDRNDHVRCLACGSYLALRVGSHEEVRIYRCTNPGCGALLGEKGAGTPVRSLLRDSATLRGSIDSLNAWWTGKVPDPKPIEWEADGEGSFFWLA